MNRKALLAGLTIGATGYLLALAVAKILGVFRWIDKYLQPMGGMENYLSIYLFMLFLFSLFVGSHAESVWKKAPGWVLLSVISGHLMGVAAYVWDELYGHLGELVDQFGIWQVLAIINVIPFMLASSLFSLFSLGCIVFLAEVTGRARIFKRAGE